LKPRQRGIRLAPMSSSEGRGAFFIAEAATRG
jgi:hypothetical protein